MHIALIYSQQEESHGSPTALKLNGLAESIKEALEWGGHKVTQVEANSHLLVNIERMEKPDLLFNLSTGLADKRSQANIVGMLEMTKIPLVGSGLNAQVLALHKEITKSLLLANHVRTARFQLLTHEQEKIREDFVYPLIVKPEHEGSGIGITLSSKVDDPADLRGVIKDKIALHNQALLIEEYLPGREFTVGVMGNRTLEILPIKETIFFPDGPPLLTNELKVTAHTLSEIPANISSELKDEIESMAEKAYRVLRCQDFARIDFRLDREGKPSIIELNTFPGLVKGYSFFPLIAEAAGYSYEALINHLAEVAVEPKGLQ